MNSGLMTVHHNYLDNFIDDPEDFSIISAEFYVDKSATKPKQIPPKLDLHN